MNPLERRATLGLSLIFVLRMLGLFMILPVFVLYAGNLEGATPGRVGLALGIYGLTQALFQLPFGLASDRLGRKPVILAGLLIFVLGSAIAAMATEIDWIILGRALQGAGAIGAVTNAFLADLTRDTVRTFAMALLGVSIGACFLLAMILGPILSAWVGVTGIFWLTAGGGILAAAILVWLVPSAPAVELSEEPHSWREGIEVLSSRELLRLDAGIFLLHALLTALFVAVPLALQDAAGLDSSEHWHVYLPVMLLSLVALLPMLYVSERRGRMRAMFLLAISLLLLSEAGLAFFHHGILTIAFCLLAFFAGFNLLEASLPSLVSRCAPAGRRGAAMGIYSSLQFLGTFCGGVLGGVILGAWGVMGVFVASAVLAALWLLVALPMAPPQSASAHSRIPAYNAEP